MTQTLYTRDYSKKEYNGIDMDRISNPDLPIMDKNISYVLEEKGYSKDYLDKKVNEVVIRYGQYSREAFIACLDIITTFIEENLRTKIPYTFGGWHGNNYKPSYDKEDGQFFEDINNGFDELSTSKINPATGTSFDDAQQERYAFKIKDNDKYLNSTIYKSYGPDCTGIIMWALRAVGVPSFNKSSKDMVMGFLDDANQKQYLPLGSVYYFNDEVNKKLNNEENYNEARYKFNENHYMGKPGDIIWSPGHVVVITDINENSGIYYTSEAKGGLFGVIRSAVSISELKNGNYALINIDNLLKNPNEILNPYEYNEDVVSKLK